MSRTYETALNKLYNALKRTNSLHISGYLLISAPFNFTPAEIDIYITALVLSN